MASETGETTSLDDITRGARTEDPVYAAYRERVAGIAEGTKESTRWSDDDKLGNLVVSVYETPADAERVFAASNDLSRGYAEQYGFVTKAEEVDDLGDEAWVLLVSSNGRGATTTGAGQTSSSRRTSTATAPAHGTSSLAHGPGRMRSMRRREAASSCRQVAGRSDARACSRLSGRVRRPAQARLTNRYRRVLRRSATAA